MTYKARTYVRLLAMSDLSGETFEDIERQAKEFRAKVLSGEIPAKCCESKCCESKVELHFEPTQEEYVVSDYWTCEQSPIGRCEYGPDDPANDSCVHCGDPEERK